MSTSRKMIARDLDSGFGQGRFGSGVTWVSTKWRRLCHGVRRTSLSNTLYHNIKLAENSLVYCNTFIHSYSIAFYHFKQIFLQQHGDCCSRLSDDVTAISRDTPRPAQSNHVTWRQNREEQESTRTRKWAWEAGMRSSLRNRRAEHGATPSRQKSGALSRFNYQPALTCFRGNLAVTVRTVWQESCAPVASLGFSAPPPQREPTFDDLFFLPPRLSIRLYKALGCPGKSISRRIALSIKCNIDQTC